jgi:hypothetical protein
MCCRKSAIGASASSMFFYAKTKGELALTMDWTKTRRKGDRNRSEIMGSNWRDILVWEVSHHYSWAKAA